MKRGSILFLFLLIGLSFISSSGQGEKMYGINIPDPSIKAKEISYQSEGIVKPGLNFGKFPLYFITNKGQVNKQVKFYARASHYTLWLTAEGLVFDSFKRSKVKGERSKVKGERSKVKGERSKVKGERSKEESVDLFLHSPNLSCTNARDVSRLMFVGANKHPKMAAVNETRLKVNYFIGNDKSKWHCGVPSSQAVMYRNLYKNIDLKVYGMENQIEYDWIIRPGGKPEDIRFTYKNAKGTRIDERGNLVIETEFGELTHKKPVSYQKRTAQSAARTAAGSPLIENSAGSDEEAARRGCPVNKSNNQVIGEDSPGDERQLVDVTFKKIGKNTYGFSVGKYDRGRVLIIDPLVLVYSTYLGGSDNDWFTKIALDSSGYVYICGTTESIDFPRMNEYQTDNQGHRDVFVVRIDPTQSGASGLIYSTYLGGDREDSPGDLAVDSSGSVYVTGRTYSKDFPFFKGYQRPNTWYGNEVFVTRLDTTKVGAASLLYSTCLGGDQHDSGWGIAADEYGCAYVTGYTCGRGFPFLKGFKKGEPGAFLSKIDTTQTGTASLLYSTCLGESIEDTGRDITIDESGNAYIAGLTRSYNFPIKNGYQTNKKGDIDAFVTKIDTNRSGNASLVYSTYLGGKSPEMARGIALDSSGIVYVTGSTSSKDFPILNGYQQNNKAGDVFITKLDLTRSGEASLIYSTFLGGEGGDFGHSIAADESGNAYVTGFTYSQTYPIRDAYQSIFKGVYDAFVTKIDTKRSGNAGLIFSTYLGGNSHDYGDGIAVDENGNIYVVGSTSSGNFPTKKSIQGTKSGYFDAFVTILKKDQPPSAAVVSPQDGDYVAGAVNIRAEAKDDFGIARVNFYIDEKLKYSDNTSPYNYNWDTSNYTTGTHKIKVEALDTIDQQGSDEITVIVQKIIITLQASRIEERAWLIKKQVGKIDFSVEKLENIPVAKYLIFRKEEAGEYVSIGEVFDTGLNSGAYSYYDVNLIRDKNCTYQVKALTADGTVVGVSAEKTI